MSSIIPSTFNLQPSTFNLLSLIVISALSFSANAAQCPPSNCGAASDIWVGGLTQHSDGIAVGDTIFSGANLSNSEGNATSVSSATYGVLRAKTSSSTLSIPFQGTSATSLATATFGDTVTITSGTLSDGALLQIELGVWLSGQIKADKGSFVPSIFGFEPAAGASATLTVEGVSLLPNIPNFSTIAQAGAALTGGVSMNETFDISNSLSKTTFDAVVGQSFFLTGYLSVTSGAGNGTNVTADFYNTGHLSFAALGGQDVTIIGNSGINYTAAPVPLPGALLFFLTGLFGLGGIANRRRK